MVCVHAKLGLLSMMVKARLEHVKAFKHTLRSLNRIENYLGINEVEEDVGEPFGAAFIKKEEETEKNKNKNKKKERKKRVRPLLHSL